MPTPPFREWLTGGGSRGSGRGPWRRRGTGGRRLLGQGRHRLIQGRHLLAEFSEPGVQVSDLPADGHGGLPRRRGRFLFFGRVVLGRFRLLVLGGVAPHRPGPYCLVSAASSPGVSPCGDRVYARKLRVRGANAFEAPIKPAAPRL